ncbi:MULTISPECIES: transcriptional repressor AlsR [Pasteurella]|uniref:transcriptional repressor AlsR n=1 Tax=Pasteurella TaxID=745 RepID=UPI00076DF08D|nr:MULTISPECIES: MurR/RpiR family transcriptional regulator [Pasteurella]AMM81120.1 transcriptional regulator [Pasteurella multocida subsp. multocida PMTB2.1]APW57815.1 MurR/RpiR family transcriptional regulator [Pasteurella multocida]ATC21221.1 MurR/RpiR family transcriptional regulator [Pasteurella multocida]AXQ72673.1 transcriptional regulator [Pasteurella multocida subsp. multocida]KWW10419.1 transcriptional regulator [Pasteurella multocida]
MPNELNSLLPNIRMKREGMTETEKKVVDWLLDSTKFNKQTSLNFVAESLSVSEALVVKVAKILGFSGFRELRQKIVSSFETTNTDTIELSKQDSVQDLINKVFNVSLQTILEGKSILETKVLERAALCFFAAKQRDLYAAGGSNSICDDIAHKFLRIGIRCNTFRDIHLMMMSASLLSEQDVVLVVSHSGKTADLLKVVKEARENGAKIICITHSDISPIVALSDFVICTPAPDTQLLGKNASARILQLILVDAFFMAVAKLDMQRAEENLQKTFNSTEMFRQK